MKIKSRYINIKLFEDIKFPHITRIFNAGIAGLILKISTAAFLAVLIVLNIMVPQFSLKKDPVFEIKNRVMREPFNYSLHEKLAKEYLTFNIPSSEKEYRLAEFLYNENTAQTDKVLGVQSSPLQTWLGIKNYKNEIENEISYWERVNEKYPDYIYGYLKQAYDNYNLGKKGESLTFLEKVLSFNPQNRNALFLLEKLQKD